MGLEIDQRRKSLELKWTSLCERFGIKKKSLCLALIVIQRMSDRRWKRRTERTERTRESKTKILNPERKSCSKKAKI